MYYAALISPAAHHQELDSLKLRVALAADFDEKGVEIDVEKSRRHRDEIKPGVGWSRGWGPRARGSIADSLSQFSVEAEHT